MVGRKKKSEPAPKMSGEQFRALVLAAGFTTQAEFARFIRHDIGTVSRWATGRAEVPHLIQVLLNLMVSHTESLEGIARRFEAEARISAKKPSRAPKTRTWQDAARVVRSLLPPPEVAAA